MPEPLHPAHVHLAVALDGAGWHPAAWREPDARPADLLTAGYWVDLVQEAERGLLDLVTLEDGLSLQSDDPWTPDERTDRVRGRLDAVQVAARVAPVTRGIGLVPTAVVTHTEPFHLSKALATLDYVSTGRAGVRVKVSSNPAEYRHVGRREAPVLDRGDLQAQQVRDLFDEAADWVEVVRRLWDSWEDDAEIRDAATGRFVDRERLHRVDFAGRWFSVKGPSITPRPPQGQPLVTALAHATVPYELVARSADVGFVTPRDAADAAGIVGEIRAAQQAAGRAGETVHVFGDLVVVLDDDPAAAAARLRRLDDVAGAEYRSDARVFTGSAAQLADLLTEWAAAGLTGFRLRPATLPHDLVQVTGRLVPELQRRGLFRTAYEAGSLRGLLGLPRPANRYATARNDAAGAA
ncbi:Flavin-dependent oxidoreductase, luciferase family (includes alkanesulfonate monooxygenase SsuD and methylene tetrahydromethanopterin reductase) [Geodermatophilus aquaeductus]|uniref:Flavin-dependent oxidoreductase, luciferase family (Includes alkanesulfonate monooxygenase SsuD and methylene tetrahydromethanopterin reductase) n=1 Tax=Geodermatophilus aquaeductus TaxID=1564161 RepID=A0A521DRH8_9ACTN|nr:LLM class flavin-dependent oxidoreductase [Geodermatophilus aquaeductus]SMO73731.1 Flavin-dependent oxidoreductase, luciferase family (includes alkanesulfonate monooxygenase SsuD and methylene tetrahydromethanopterin reductase) [Geodermatophilus aquaeductus]